MSGHSFLENWLIWRSWGKYPPYFNEKIHGPYDPARYYPKGVLDKKLSEVTIGELPLWLARREKNPRAFFELLGRAFWRYKHAYLFPKYASGLAPWIHFCVCYSMWAFYLKSEHHYEHRLYKYHW